MTAVYLSNFQEIWWALCRWQHCLTVCVLDSHSGHVFYLLLTSLNIDGLVQERRNSNANALVLRLSCSDPAIYTYIRLSSADMPGKRSKFTRYDHKLSWVVSSWCHLLDEPTISKPPSVEPSGSMVKVTKLCLIIPYFTVNISVFAKDSYVILFESHSYLSGVIETEAALTKTCQLQTWYEGQREHLIICENLS